MKTLWRNNLVIEKCTSFDSVAFLWRGHSIVYTANNSIGFLPDAYTLFATESLWPWVSLNFCMLLFPPLQNSFQNAFLNLEREAERRGRNGWWGFYKIPLESYKSLGSGAHWLPQAADVVYIKAFVLHGEDGIGKQLLRWWGSYREWGTSEVNLSWASARICHDRRGNCSFHTTLPFCQAAEWLPVPKSQNGYC